VRRLVAIEKNGTEAGAGCEPVSATGFQPVIWFFPTAGHSGVPGSRFKVKSAALQCEMRRPPLVAEIPAFTEEFLAA
jgi:hypothetical protein